MTETGSQSNELVKSQTTDLVPAGENPALWADIAYSMVVDEEAQEDEEPTPTLVLISERYGLSKREAMKILGEPTFAQFMHNMAKAVARADFNRTAFKRLVDIIRDGTDRNSISATKELAKILGYTKDEGININISLEERLSKSSGPVETVDGEILPGL